MDVFSCQLGFPVPVALGHVQFPRPRPYNAGKRNLWGRAGAPQVPIRFMSALPSRIHAIHAVRVCEGSIAYFQPGCLAKTILRLVFTDRHSQAISNGSKTSSCGQDLAEPESPTHCRQRITSLQDATVPGRPEGGGEEASCHHLALPSRDDNRGDFAHRIPDIPRADPTAARYTELP